MRERMRRRPARAEAAVEARPGFPAVLRPREEVDLAEWSRAHRETLESLLLRHGALLFRGFGLQGAEDLEACGSALEPDLHAEYSELPRLGSGRRSYRSTPYPKELEIRFHNEAAHRHRWPLRQWFLCQCPAAAGGETPLSDGRLLARRLDPAWRERLERHGLLYVRTFRPGLDLAWQEFFGTDDRQEVESLCAASGAEWEWLEDGLRLRSRRPALLAHPDTGETCFFGQVLLHHPAALPPDARRALGDGHPRDVLYGDGSPLEDEAVERLAALYEECSVSFPWEQGDLLLVDNLLVAHARRPYEGERSILVAMARMVSAGGAPDGGQSIQRGRTAPLEETWLRTWGSPS